MVLDRRAELVEAGIRSLSELRFEDVLNAVEARTIAEAAGVSTGSFFHHFRNRRHFAEAVLDRWFELWGERVRRLTTHAARAADNRGHGGVRDAAALEWEALAGAGAMEAIQHVVWGLRARPLVDGSSRTGRDLLGAAYAELASTVRAEYERGMRAIEREPMPPFTQAEMEVMTTAIADGLQLRAGVDPDAVRPELYGDAMAALLLGATRPRKHRDDDGPGVDLAQLRLRLGGPSPAPTAHGPAGPAGLDSPVERWRQIAEAAAHLFVDRSPQEVRTSEVAASAGVGTSLVRQEFDSVVAVAAAGWVRHIPELHAIASAPANDDSGAGEEDPMRRVERVLLRYVELLRENRGAGEALVAQILAEARPGADPPRRDVRSLVPIPGMLEPSIADLRRRGRLRRGVEITRVSRSLVHLITTQALLFSDDSPERVLDEVMGMVFDGVTVEPSGG